MSSSLTLPKAAGPRAVLALIVFPAVLSTACLDLGAVKRVVSVSQEAAAPFRQIAADMPASCRRAASYQPPDVPPPAACPKLEKLEPSLLAVQGVLDRYFDALGQLADDQAVSFATPMDQISDAVKDGTSVDAAKVDAVNGLAKYLADLVTSAYRNRKLQEVIAAQNANIQTVLTALKDITGKDYRQLLENETAGLQIRYETALQYRTKEPLAAILVEEQWRDKRKVLSARLAAIDVYQKALGHVATAHQRLYDHKNELGAKDLASALYSDAKTLKTLIDQVRKAF